MSKRIDARCPVCGEWDNIRAEAVGQEMECANCHALVRPVPRSSQARAWRRVVMGLIVIGGIVLLGILYEARVDELTRMLAGVML